MVSSLKIGGAERVMLDLARAQSRSGLNVRVLSFGSRGDFLVEEAAAHGIEVVALKELSPIARVRQILGAVGGKHADVVQIHTPFGMRIIAPLMPLIRARIIYTRHGMFAMRSLSWRLVHAWVRLFVDAVTFVAPEGQAAASHWNGSWSQPSVVIENGVDTEVETTRSPSPDGRIRLGSVGRLVALKGHRFLFDSLAALAPDERARVRLEIFGDGEQRSELERYAAERLPDVPVCFHGPVMERERIYRETDVLVVSSRTEGLSMAIMEAMARSIPVVATEVGGNPTLVRPEETGLLVTYNEPESLAAGLRRILADARMRERLGRQAREFIRREYSLARMAERYRELYGLPSD